jgi:hypothetical protein
MRQTMEADQRVQIKAQPTHCLAAALKSHRHIHGTSARAKQARLETHQSYYAFNFPFSLPGLDKAEATMYMVVVCVSCGDNLHIRGVVWGSAPCVPVLLVTAPLIT